MTLKLRFEHVHMTSKPSHLYCNFGGALYAVFILEETMGPLIPYLQIGKYKVDHI